MTLCASEHIRYMDHKGVENAETAFVFRQMMKCNLMLVRARAVVYPPPLRGTCCSHKSPARTTSLPPLMPAGGALTFA